VKGREVEWVVGFWFACELEWQIGVVGSIEEEGVRMRWKSKSIHFCHFAEKGKNESRAL
jgi:hypothetical protein